MNQRKIFNDPLYGLVSFPYDILYQLIDHKYFQRLRRISQLGLTHYVYTGACHSRFHHALGALHLMTRALDVLQKKGIEITEEESKGVCIAILLHDIGHGPFSHALEHTIINVHHETLSLYFMEILNEEFKGQLDMAIQIFKGEHPKDFLHQLVSSQLDMDRLDYLSRDSYYTGVAEGVIGYDRIISMLNVVEGQLVVEEKGLYSIEKFLMARKVMYWQVYLHKTVLSAEQMLIKFLEVLIRENDKLAEDALTPALRFFMNGGQNMTEKEDKMLIIRHFSALDDYDVWYTLKKMVYSDQRILQFLAKRLMERKLFKINLEKTPISVTHVEQLRQRLCKQLKVAEDTAENLIIRGKESNQAYTTAQDEIQILSKTGQTVPFSKLTENLSNTPVLVKYFLCYPRI